ncbi:Haloacid dehalogenase-like hydrolase-domain-containing protein [Mariannaea sp. PMI_226]|nr:Haloacid dehalogenase-like hydrolase-domain-containing protein [Mariannaea sp. PMI_226]
MAPLPVTTIILDIGDVICSWVPPTTCPITPKLFGQLRNTPTWYEYNCGRIDEKECYSQLAAHAGVSTADIANTIKMARKSQAQNDELVSTVRQIREQHPGLRVYAMSNIPRPEWEILKANENFDWKIFDDVFLSCEAGMCKPELRFYRHVLESTKTSPSRVVFVDDKLDNVVAAQSFGFWETIIFDKTETVIRKLLNAVGNPAQRGRDWLKSQAKKLYSETSNGAAFYDNFSQLLIYEVMKDINLLLLDPPNRTWQYFVANGPEIPGMAGPPAVLPPDDLDTTSYALRLLHHEESAVHSSLDQMVSPSCTTPDGIVKVFFNKPEDRVEPTVCINVVRVFYSYGRGNQLELQATKDWIHDVLFYRGYLKGTRYYPSPDVFLYFFAQLLHENPVSDLSRWLPLFRERLIERVNCEGDSMSLAMRVLACELVGLSNKTDLRRLLDLQEEDGSFGLGWLCRYGKSGIMIGSRGLTTAVAISAIEGSKRG